MVNERALEVIGHGEAVVRSRPSRHGHACARVMVSSLLPLCLKRKESAWPQRASETKQRGSADAVAVSPCESIKLKEGVKLRDAFLRGLVARHFELHGAAPAQAEVRALEAACFPGLKPMLAALLAPECTRSSRPPLLCSVEARQTGLAVEGLLGLVIKPLHDFKRISERVFWVAFEAAGTREATDVTGEAIHLTSGKTAGQDAIKKNMKQCLGKGMDGMKYCDWRQVFMCFREIVVRYLPARCVQMFELLDLTQEVAWTTKLSDGGWKLVQCVVALALQLLPYNAHAHPASCCSCCSADAHVNPFRSLSPTGTACWRWRCSTCKSARGRTRTSPMPHRPRDARLPSCHGRPCSTR